MISNVSYTIMGLFSSKSVDYKAANLAVSNIRPNMIDMTRTQTINLENYDIDKLKQEISHQVTEIGSMRAKMIRDVFDDADFTNMHHLADHKDIYFIDSNCYSILHIHNNSGMTNSMDRVMTLNLTVLETLGRHH